MKRQLLEESLVEGAWVTSSGTTGLAKKIFRSPENIRKCNQVAVRAQNITPQSSIYTVTKMTHAGGLLAQSLPAISVGADLTIEKFDPYRFLSVFKDHSHTFLPPAYMLALTKTKQFQNYDFSGKRILTGSSPITSSLMKKYLLRNAVVQPNWGMSEVGPITIYSIIKDLSDLERLNKKRPEQTTLLGDIFEIEYKVLDSELWVRGDLCIQESWFPTGDLVKVVDEVLFYVGRKSFE